MRFKHYCVGIDLVFSFKILPYHFFVGSIIIFRYKVTPIALVIVSRIPLKFFERVQLFAEAEIKCENPQQPTRWNYCRSGQVQLADQICPPI
jgi:hypothetical protein